jgi:hypothetical protein
MKRLVAAVALVSVFSIGSSVAFAMDSVKITEPKDGSTVSSPVKVCMETHGVEVQPAKEGVHKGKGHHHLLVDTDVPHDLSQPIGKDDHHIHMGDGSTCKELTLSHGHHTIKALFAMGNHVPYDPAITDSISIEVK